MSLFCDNCNNLLTIVTSPDNLYSKCMKCAELYDYKIEQTMMYESEEKTDFTIYRNILLEAGNDRTNPKVKKKCNKCSYNLMRQVRLGSDMRLINICIKCGNTQYNN